MKNTLSLILFMSLAVLAGPFDVRAESPAPGIKYYFVEDESHLVEEQIPKSLGYLETIRW